ncbi:hypothetical protein BHE74_00038937, partial [Ensete ventricosum]
FGFLRLGSSLGINYGQVANDLPSPEQVRLLLTSLRITKTRIYDTNPRVLTAFANTGIDLIVTVPNEAFLAATKSPFWINAYPYFAYKDSPAKVPLDYVLFNPNAGMVDPYTKLRYDNMLYAQVDAVIFAIARLGYGGVEVRVSETGWPSKGDPNEVGATVENARAYNRNLLLRQMRSEGTPVRPNQRLEVYLFALFNEDMKPGPTSERNYGLYQPDGTMVYNVGLAALTSSASVSLTSSATRVRPRLPLRLQCGSVSGIFQLEDFIMARDAVMREK